MRSLSHVRNVSTSCIVANNFAEPSCSHLCVEDVGDMGKEPADTCIPHRVDHRTVAVLHMSYLLLTQVIGGLCNISDRNDLPFELRRF